MARKNVEKAKTLCKMQNEPFYFENALIDRYTEKEEKTMKEEILVERMQEGSKEAFDMLYEKYKDSALRTAYLIMGSLADAEDVVQDTFVKVYLHCRELKNRSGFKAWMMQILVRTAYRTAKKRKREFPDEEAVNRMEDRVEFSSLEKVMQMEETEKLWKAVSALPYKHRTVVILFYYEQLSVSEIAGTLGILEGTVKSRLHTARRRMKEALLETVGKGL